MTIILQALLEAAITAEYGDTPARAELEQQLAANRAEIDRLNTVILAKDAAYAALFEEHKGILDANDTLGEANRQLQDVIENLREANEVLRSESREMYEEIVTLKARIKELEAILNTPPSPPPPPPEEPPPPVPTDVPTTLAFKALTSNASRASYITSTEAWYKANTGPRSPITTTRGGGNIAGTFRNTRFTGGIIPATGTTLIDCQVDGPIDADKKIINLDHCRIDGKGGAWGVLGNVRAEYCDIFNAEDGIKTQNDGWSIRWCYLHGPAIRGSDPHNDGIQMQWRNTNGLIENCWVQWRDTSELFAQVQNGEPIDNLVWRGNWCGGSDHPLRIEAGCTNCQVLDNVVKKGHWGYYDLISSVVKSGNVDWVTGAAI